MSRPRDPETDRRILEAAGACFSERGYAGTSMEAIARRAGVGKPALYLRYRGKAQLMFELTMYAATADPLPDTGSIVDDLVEMLTRLAASLEGPPRAVFADRIGAMIGDPEFFNEVWERQAGPVAHEVHGLWLRAVERGEIASDAPGWRIVNDLSYVVICRQLIFHDTPTPAEIVELVQRNVAAARSPAG